MEIYYPTDDEIEQFRESSQNVYDHFREVWGDRHLNTFLKEANGSEVDEG